MARWAVDATEISACADQGTSELSSAQCRDIDEFKMSELAATD
jgi:hypothetical protein